MEKYDGVNRGCGAGDYLGLVCLALCDFCLSGDEDDPHLRVMSPWSGEFMTWSRGKG